MQNDRLVEVWLSFTPLVQPVVEPLDDHAYQYRTWRNKQRSRNHHQLTDQRCGNSQRPEWVVQCFPSKVVVGV